jgi:hypothetical protein
LRSGFSGCRRRGLGSLRLFNALGFFELLKSLLSVALLAPGSLRSKSLFLGSEFCSLGGGSCDSFKVRCTAAGIGFTLTGGCHSYIVFSV